MSRLSQVLLFDTDSRGRDILSYGLEGEGVTTNPPGHASELLALASGPKPPDVLIVVLRGTADEGWVLLRQVAEAEHLRDIPRLVLAAAAELPGDLRDLPGATSFLPLPAFVRDVITAAKLLAAVGSAPHSETPLVGTLSEYGLLFIVRTMVGLRRSGTVVVERAHRKGELRFSEGNLVSAQVASLQGQPALHQLLLWEEAALEIRFRPVTGRDQSFPVGDQLLDETERFLRDFAHATKSIGHAQSLFIQDAEKLASMVDSVSGEVMPVLKLFDGQRSLGDVLEDSPFRAFDTLNFITRLIELGIIRRKAIEKPSTGLAGQVRRPRVEEWIQRSSDAPTIRPSAPAIEPLPAPATTSAATPSAFSPTMPAAAAKAGSAGPAPSVNGLAGASSSNRRRRSRRRTGEVPLGEAAARGSDSNKAKAGELAVRGELRSEREPPHDLSSDHMPKVLVDLGPGPDGPSFATLVSSPAVPAPIIGEREVAIGSISDDAGEAAATQPRAVVAAIDPAIAAASASVAEAPTAAEPDSAAAGDGIVAPTEQHDRQGTDQDGGRDSGGVPEQRLTGIRSAEIDTGARPAPPQELLEAPASGPSIMLDPHLIAEMDAFELANTAATPPPVVTAAPPAPAAPPTTRPSPRPVGPGDAVVSFVHGSAHPGPAHPAPPAGSMTLNSAPTVPISPVAGPHPSPAAASPGHAPPTPHPHPRSPTPGPTDPGAPGRRASGEFNALEADFFARESDLYHTEPTESFDDLDPNARERRRRS